MLPVQAVGAYNVERVSTYSKGESKVIHQLINIALVLEEVWVLVVDVPLGDETTRHQRLAGQFHDPHHPGKFCGFLHTASGESQNAMGLSRGGSAAVRHGQ